MNTRPILVTGAHRSGSTWTGKMLALDHRIGYIREPFNPGSLKSRILSGGKFDYWYTYICEENGPDYYQILHDILTFRRPLAEKLALAGTARRKTGTTWRHLGDLKHRLLVHRPLIKDPIAFFSSAWLAKTFDMNVVVVVRHPAAFAASLKTNNWNFDFRNFLDQPMLMRDHLEPYRDRLEAIVTKSHDIIDTAILIWLCIYGTACRLKANHPEWIFIRHEDLSRDPVAGFKELYKRLELDMSRSSEKAITMHSRVRGNSRIVRNSRENINRWRKILTESEIIRVKDSLESTAAGFYSEDEW
jgi:hypothetical protein